MVLVGSFPGALLMVGLVVCLVSGSDPRLFVAGLAVLGFGVLGSYLLHECCHWSSVALTCPTATACWEITPLRMSLLVRGQIAPTRAGVNAAAGPLGCAVLGGMLLALAATGSTTVHHTVAAMGWLHLAHLVFLVPPSTDGVVVLRSLRGRRPVVPTTSSTDGGIPVGVTGPGSNAKRHHLHGNGAD